MTTFDAPPATSSAPELLALHGLRLAGFADAAAIGRRVGLTAVAVASCLDRLAAADLVAPRPRKSTGGTGTDGTGTDNGSTTTTWALTAAGRRRGEALLAAELDGGDLRPGIVAAYHRFRPLNRRVLEIFTRWQIVDLDAQRLNDHTDADYDAAVIADLGFVDDEIQPIVADLAGALTRFERYGPALSNARRRIEAGDADYVTKPLIDSYHTVWFELHEDLLATLGLDRGAETCPPTART